MSEIVLLNGRLVPAADARVSIFDAGITHAVGLFETLRAYNGRIMRLGEHLDRMTTSIDKLEMEIRVDRDAIGDQLDELLRANGLRDARLRLTITPGPIPRDDAADPRAGPTLFASATPVTSLPAETYRDGIRVCICPYRQNRADPLAGHKTLSYFPRLLAMKDAARRRCGESLWFTTENLLAEGSMCNIFVVHDGGLLTPPTDTPILPGVVRRAVMDVARSAGIAVEERPIDINLLLAASEVFVTGSVREIVPVIAIERHDVGEGRPGELTQRLMKLYRELVASECG